MTLRWYVAETHAGCERGAELRLRDQGFEPFLPTCFETRTVRGKPVRVVLPLFPRYLLVRFDVANDRWRSVNGTRGVKRLLGGEDSPAWVPDRQVDLILDRCEDGPIEEPAFVVDELVRIVAGPLADELGRVVSNDRGRVVVLLTMLARPVEVPIPVDWLRSA